MPDALCSDELVGYIENDRALEALAEAREEYGEDVKLERIKGVPDDDVWPPESDRWKSNSQRDEEGQDYYNTLMDAHERSSDLNGYDG